MIEKISPTIVNSRNLKLQSDKKSNPEFKGAGLGTALLGAVQACEQNPMLNVTVLDLATAIVPRTLYEGQTNAFAGLEAFRRESSGLIINCLVPGFIVAGFAKLLQKQIMGFDTKMGSSWANEETLKTIAEYYKSAVGEGDEKIKNTYKNMLSGLSGKNIDETVEFSKFNWDEVAEQLTQATKDSSKSNKKAVKDIFSSIAKETLVTEHVSTTINGHKFSGKLASLVEESPRILGEFVKGSIQKASDIDNFVSKGTKLVTAKSLLGLGVIIPLAIAAQPINRWITAKTSGRKGAPIYRDFADSKQKELTPKEKHELAKQKVISVSAMVGVALLSIMKKPNMAMFKEITQFKGIFPSMDQARIISTATFASRMMASEDKNDLREATVRDIATFSAFYFLGDYVAKGIATLMPKQKLINYLEDYKKDAKGINKLWQWAKNTSLKSSDELVGTAAKNMRSVCQVGNIAFSLAALGVVIPMITRKKTDKQHEEEMKKQGVDQKTIQKFYPRFTMNSESGAQKGNVYQAFFTSK